MNKKSFHLSCFILLLTALSAAAFEWPQDNVFASAIASGFAYLRGGKLSGSLIFTTPAEIKASAEGIVLAVVRPPDDGETRFYSPLGNAVIIDHQDDLITVYGNMETIRLSPQTIEVASGDIFGTSGSSGWRTAGTGLEFQAIDVKNKRLINPYPLMPRIGDERIPRIYGVTAVGRQDETFRLSETASFSAGIYTLYYDFDPVLLPYRTSISINGTIEETITYDMLIERNGKLSLRGKRYYTQEEIYLNNRQMLLAEVSFLRGRNTITIVSSNMYGVETTSVVYVINNF
jgi:hypothetical protein